MALTHEETFRRKTIKTKPGSLHYDSGYGEVVISIPLHGNGFLMPREFAFFVQFKINKLLNLLFIFLLV